MALEELLMELLAQKTYTWVQEDATRHTIARDAAHLPTNVLLSKILARQA